MEHVTDLRALLADVSERIASYHESLGTRPAFPSTVEPAAIRAALGTMQDDGVDAASVVEELARAVEPGLVASAGGRYFGFVIGASTDAALAADLLATGWDQNGFNPTTSPAAAAVEEVASEWLVDVLRLPPTASVGFVTGAQGANTVGLAAARHRVLSDAGWDVEQRGLVGAPAVRVVAAAERHATIDRSLRLLGLGTDVIEPVPCDGNGTIVVEELERVLAAGPPGPTIVCLQAGNVNTGAFDDLSSAVPLAHEHGAWVHVDGAFGLWAAAAPSTRHLLAGHERADSWATDGHKWLNVPYDSGYVFCADRATHAGAMSFSAAYLTGQQGPDRTPSDFVIESSRRARGLATWAALRELGRSGVAELVTRTCALARRFADGMREVPGADVANEVVLNQVLVGFGDDARTDRVVDAVQRSGEAWMGATTWHGRRLMRVSVSSCRSTEADIDRAVAAVRAAAEGAGT
jgi:glutamate/tyrosine decarboxylase-like PLP-dependent enzyme